MLTLYRRHRKECPYSDDRYHRRCTCTVWAQGTIEGTPIRESLKTRSWERAEQIKRDREAGRSAKPETPAAMTIEAAIKLFIEDCESRNLTDSPLKKHKRLTRRFGDFLMPLGIEFFPGVTTDIIRRFRSTWKLSPRTAAKELERLRSFFRFCVEAGWISINPAKAVKSPKSKELPRLPFSDDEVAKILSKTENDRELAFVRILRHTGLRIGDASLLQKSAISENRVYLYTTKGGTPVHIVLPPDLVSLLNSLPAPGGYFFLFGESTKMHTTADLWRRRIKRMCKDAKVTPDHPHRFRHTLAADLLTKGASVEDVAAILGNSPAVVMKHYSQFCRRRQDRLDDLISKTWKKTLVRVK